MDKLLKAVQATDKKYNMFENADKITTAFQDYGFDYTALDLNGYKTGNMNKSIQQ